MTELVSVPNALAARLDAARAGGLRVGVVPTMGNLHEGHLSLVRGARAHGASFTVVTIFVNPLQFGPKDDFARYPRTLETDLAKCRAEGVDVVFAPDAVAMYPPDFDTYVEVGDLAARLEGAHRPGHFRGVATVVVKLLSLTAPCLATLGRKDYQQLRIVERVVRDLDMRVDVFGEPIVREPDGLAMSSRNQYLTPSDRTRAAAIWRGLVEAERLFVTGERRASVLVDAARTPIRAAFDSIDYVALADAQSLAPVEEERGRVDCATVLAVAARIGTTRLLDNTVLGDTEASGPP